MPDHAEDAMRRALALGSRRPDRAGPVRHGVLAVGRSRRGERMVSPRGARASGRHAVSDQPGEQSRRARSRSRCARGVGGCAGDRSTQSAGALDARTMRAWRRRRSTFANCERLCALYAAAAAARRVFWRMRRARNTKTSNNGTRRIAAFARGAAAKRSTIEYDEAGRGGDVRRAHRNVLRRSGARARAGLP